MLGMLTLCSKDSEAINQNLDSERQNFPIPAEFIPRAAQILSEVDPLFATWRLTDDPVAVLDRAK